MFVGDVVSPWTWKQPVVSADVRNRVGDRVWIQVQGRLEGRIWNQVDIELRIRVWSQVEFGRDWIL